MSEKHIVVFGLGYVGLSNAVLLAQHNRVTAIDIDASRVEKINRRVSPIVDKEISEFLQKSDLNLTATMDRDAAFGADYIIVATPTNYDENTDYFDTSSVQSVIDFVNAPFLSKSVFTSSKPLIIVKSTIPVGFIQSQIDRGYDNVVFMPEFLREGQALYDNLHPSRIVIGERSDRAREVAQLYQEAAWDENIPVLLTGPSEAESVKLFANTYLAMRVAYINEIDTFAQTHGLNTKEILDGVSLDPRIGTHYCNPSFGYGGYCLPKDTKQLLANYKDVPQNLIKAIVDANVTRLDWVVNQILAKSPKTVGLYRLIMKTGSDNFRASAMQEILKRLKKHEDVEVVIYEPTWAQSSFDGVEVVNDLVDFKKRSQVICANRIDQQLTDVQEKVLTRDVYHNN